MHAFHVRNQISSQISLKCAAFLLARILIAIVNASMLRQLISRVEFLLTNIAVKGFALFDAQVGGLMLLQQKIKVKLFLTVVAMPFLFGVIDPMIVQCRFCLVALIATVKVATETSHIIRVLITYVIEQRLLQSKIIATHITPELSLLQMRLLLMIKSTRTIREEFWTEVTLLEELDIRARLFFHHIVLPSSHLVLIDLIDDVSRLLVDFRSFYCFRHDLIVIHNVGE